MEQGTLLSVTSDDVREAADRIAPYVRTTPVFATEVDGRPVTLKLENLQVTGSFKFRSSSVVRSTASSPAAPEALPALGKAASPQPGGKEST
jgi:threonine dehydratase